jgi:plasmid stabilization system protein ParE
LKLVWTRRANAGLAKIIDWIGCDNPRAAHEMEWWPPVRG